MFTRILVPLDGSPLAEHALPYAVRVATATKGTLLLLRVISTGSEFGMYRPSPEIMWRLMEAEQQAVTSYLNQLVQSPALSGIAAHVQLSFGLPASTILDDALTKHADLIVLASHGETGVKRWVLGSVAQTIAWSSPIPVLLLRERGQTGMSGSAHEGVQPPWALVALDGSPFAEACLMPAAWCISSLCAPAAGRLHVATMVKAPTASEVERYEQLGLDVDVEQMERDAADHSLQNASEKCMKHFSSPPGLTITRSVHVCEDVASALIHLAETGEQSGYSGPASFVALATHGRSGMQRWLLGSVTARLLNHSPCSLLIVRPSTNPAAI